MEPNGVEEQMRRILQSETFSDKDQLKKLLEVLFRNLDSQSTLKPDRIIRELWPEETKTKQSADVATEINRLRRALKAYYDSEGRIDPIRITLPNRAAPAPDGTKERRWIAAELREGHEATACSGVPVGNPHRWLKFAIAVLAICIVGCVIVVLVTSADRQPQSGRIDNAALVIVNAEGKELWRKSFPNGFWSDYYRDGVSTHLYSQDGLESHLWFGDLDGDGHTDVLLLYHPARDSKSHSTTLICYSSSGKEKWRWSPGRVLPEIQEVPPVYITMGFRVLQPADHQHVRIVVMSRHEYYYPTQIAVVDNRGRTLSEYWHSGHLFHLELGSLAGRTEIIASGISNGYLQATLLVLDPDHISGASAETARPEVQIHGMGTPNETVRLLFPRSDLNRDLYRYNEGLAAIISPGRIQIDVKECWLTLPQGCTIVYAFDDHFVLLSASAEDTFLNAHREFYSKNKVEHPFNPDEEAQFERVRCLAGCKTDFVSTQKE